MPLEIFFSTDYSAAPAGLGGEKMSERAVRHPRPDRFVKRAIDELFSGDGNRMDVALNEDLANSYLWVRKVSDVARGASKQTSRKAKIA